MKVTLSRIQIAIFIGFATYFGAVSCTSQQSKYRQEGASEGTTKTGEMQTTGISSEGQTVLQADIDLMREGRQIGADNSVSIDDLIASLNSKEARLRLLALYAIQYRQNHGIEIKRAIPKLQEMVRSDPVERFRFVADSVLLANKEVAEQSLKYVLGKGSSALRLAALDVIVAELYAGPDPTALLTNHRTSETSQEVRNKIDRILRSRTISK